MRAGGTISLRALGIDPRSEGAVAASAAGNEASRIRTPAAAMLCISQSMLPLLLLLMLRV